MTLILIPDKKVMEEFVSDDTKSMGAKVFDGVIDIQSLTGCKIVIPSQMADRLNKRLNDDHQASFYSHVDVDNSTKGLTGYDSYTSYVFLVPKKATNPKDTVIFIGHDVWMYNIRTNGNIIQITSSSFIERINVILNVTKQLKKLSSNLTEDVILQILEQKK